MLQNVGFLWFIIVVLVIMAMKLWFSWRQERDLKEMYMKAVRLIDQLLAAARDGGNTNDFEASLFNFRVKFLEGDAIESYSIVIGVKGYVRPLKLLAILQRIIHTPQTITRQDLVELCYLWRDIMDTRVANKSETTHGFKDLYQFLATTPFELPGDLGK